LHVQKFIYNIIRLLPRPIVAIYANENFVFQTDPERPKPPDASKFSDVDLDDASRLKERGYVSLLGCNVRFVSNYRIIFESR